MTALADRIADVERRWYDWQFRQRDFEQMVAVIEAAMALRAATESHGGDEYGAEQALDAALTRFAEDADA